MGLRDINYQKEVEYKLSNKPLFPIGTKIGYWIIIENGSFYNELSQFGRFNEDFVGYNYRLIRLNTLEEKVLRESVIKTILDSRK